ncbi:TIGR01244 family sulfur transferase [Roseisalinus antarcticus]|uniref:Beta-lactamase hydrolase-like protein n=1 Tax=Roseisalinus antarcticus TaxID=254357 RepID=A0A1Y5RKQ6_9RHOB|nr:protein tyrosine phosphatase family protein [Roseisalinus antarcticus]SLN19776.1 Beta-lactamase hydrolase-like protein [Roseisalinus antarcticus]
MTYSNITDTYAVSGQITPADLAGIKAAGFGTVICNRPDAENPPALQAEAMRAEAEAEGLAFVDNPFSHQSFSLDLVDRQTEALAAADGPVFAYCASGNRCSVLWAMGRVKSGEMTPEAAINSAAEAGYDLSGLKMQLSALAPG